LADYLNTHAETIVLIVVVFLALFSLIVFVGAVYSRWMLNLRERKKDEVREKLSELIIQYISDDLTLKELKSHLSTKIDYSILLKLSNKLDQSLEGEEEARLKRLMNLQPIRHYFTSRFDSGSPLDKAKACLYFSRQPNIKKAHIPVILKYTGSDFPMLAYSACLVIVVHGRQEQKMKAIHNLLVNRGISDQALNDIFSEFQANADDDGQQEAKMLMSLIESGRYSDERIALLIRILGELNVYESTDFLFKKYCSLSQSDYPEPVACALLDTLSGFGDVRILDRIQRVFVNSSDREVRESAARAMGKIMDPVNVPILKWMLFDPDFYVRFHAATSLAGYPDVDLLNLNLPDLDSEEYDELLGEIESAKQMEY
jgi:hypothetical protein